MEPQPTAVVFQNPIASDQLAFLNDYAGRPATEALKDKRLRALMKAMTPRTEYHYGRDMPLSYAIDMVLEGSKDPVVIRDGRYATVSGSNGPYLRGRGFLWFDLQAGTALGGFYFQPVNGEPTPTFTVFSRQLRENSLAMSQLPPEFAGDVIQSATQAGVPPVEARYFIPQDGRKYVLLHDEDYCGHAEGQPAPPEAICGQLAANAADADLHAAAFMAETHHAANATAWRLSPDLLKWMDVRNNACAPGPEMWMCRVRMTRQRTRMILTRQ
jgi:hypothetical protein